MDKDFAINFIERHSMDSIPYYSFVKDGMKIEFHCLDEYGWTVVVRFINTNDTGCFRVSNDKINELLSAVGFHF